jgi:glycosyltransferase involved in cell wall biosynthesis
MDRTELKDFSVVIPVFNSEAYLPELFQRIKNVFNNMQKTFEVIFVNDCSKDNSYKVLKEIYENNQNVVFVDFMKNYGQQNALMCGFNYCNGQYIITLDDDLQNPPEEIPRLYEKIKEGYDAVFGSYSQKKHRAYKNLGSFFIRKLNHKIFKTADKIKFSSFRIIKKSIIDEIKLMRTPFPYISGMILSITSSVTNVEITHLQRAHGKSNYNIKKLINLSFNLLINYSSIPLRVVGSIGLIVSIVSFVFGCLYIMKKLFIGTPVPGWTTIVVLISFYNSIILIIFFILGEYISRILREISNFRQFTTREVFK